MACRDHNGSVRAEVILQQHKHRGRGGKTRFDHVSPARQNAFGKAVYDALRRKAGIVPDGNRHVLFVRARRRKPIKGFCDFRHGFVSERNRVALGGDRRTAHVGAVFQFQKFV